MKCPKCSYLGFETGDRCKNCGYDFSLITEPTGPGEIDIDIDLALRPSDDTLPVSVRWDDKFDGALTASPFSRDLPDPVLPALAPPRAQAKRTGRELPLFGPAFDVAGDEPLIKLPATPRPPLAVRRTPDTPRLRTVPKPSRPIASAPALDFAEEAPAMPIGESAADVRARTAALLAPPLPQPAHAEVSGAGRRLAAAAVDHLLLSAIDLSVIYFTLRMAGLPMAQWTVLPPAPLLAFLLLVKLSYFCAFTAVGGQTIGKMAARIRVVTTEDASVDGALAVRRTLAGAVSAALLGLGYLPALIGSDRRALHDRVTRTRVIALPSI
jgi:uncharacterized RDD family membrane protein YckC